jgi:predicted DNA-binding transcriptional regulator AlpA
MKVRVRELSVTVRSETLRKELESTVIAVRTISREELPRLLGDLEEIRATALARLASPGYETPVPDSLIGVAEASVRLGISRHYLYRNHRRFSFTRRMGRSLLFSSNGIEQYIRRINSLTAKR